MKKAVEAPIDNNIDQATHNDVSTAKRLIDQIKEQRKSHAVAEATRTRN